MKNQTRIAVNQVGKRYWLFKRYRERLQQALLAPILRRDFAESFWALRNVSFELNSGEVLGIIGINGSGKSTLLQIIAGTLKPTTGSVNLDGRLTALLELGAGFHPEFTGRENVYLSGAVMGIPEKEMKARFQQIIDFADIGDFIDQPVKLYSSGMYVRLAFSIATCVDPDILVVDEALAVGDAGFVIKCMDRMANLRDRGTAIVLVTHDIQTVRSICDRAIWLSHGEPRQSGKPIEVTSRYLEEIYRNASVDRTDANAPSTQSETDLTDSEQWIPLSRNKDSARWGTGQIAIQALKIAHPHGKSRGVFNHGENLKISIRATVLDPMKVDHLGFGLSFRNTKGLDIITTTTLDQGIKFPQLSKGQTIEVDFELTNILAPGEYSLVLNAENRVSIEKPEYLDFIENAFIIRVISDRFIFSQVLPEVNHTIRVLANSLLQE